MRTASVVLALLVTPPTAAAALTVASAAHALTQPGGATIPTAPGCNSGKPTGLAAAFACVCTQAGVCNIGAACASPSPGTCDDGNHGTCETTMAHVFNDNTCIPSKLTGLDPIAEARTTPETFRPTCALTFTVVTRGTALFRDGFGWYNVTGQKPDPSDLHGMIGCNDAAGKSVVLDIQGDPAYRGGEVGFFLVTPESLAQRSQCAGGDCCATVARAAAGNGQIYYSERKYNPDQAAANSLIHLLVFDSKITRRKFYFAWEDIYGASNNDFTDLVTSVDGVECSGGGVSCATGQKGRCGVGVRACSAGTLGCEPVFQAEPEACDGVDNDCNGAIDDGAKCASADDICQNGTCVHKCGGNEFPCKTPGTSCDQTTGFCVDPACIGFTCAAHQICRNGQCGAPCAGVVCPKGQTCTGNACVDLCSGKSCPNGQACKDGICFAGCAQCGGTQCTLPETCDTAAGTCKDTTCAAPCAPGTRCESGICQDTCAAVVCPAGTTCSNGQCGNGQTSPTGADGGLIGAGPDTNGEGGAGGDANGESYGADKASGCACTSGTGGGGAGWAAAGALLVLALGGRRRTGG